MVSAALDDIKWGLDPYISPEQTIPDLADTLDAAWRQTEGILRTYNSIDSLIKNQKWDTALSAIGEVWLFLEQNELLSSQLEGVLRFKRGYVYMQLSQYGNASEDLVVSSELLPDFGGSYALLALIEAANGNLNQSLKLMNQAIERNRSVAAFYGVRGQLNMMRRDYEAALADMNHPGAVTLNTPKMWILRTAVKHETGDISGALKDAKRFVKKYPDHLLGHNDLAFLFLVAGKPGNALNEWNLVTRNPNAPHYAFAGHAVANWKAGQHEKAIDLYRAAIKKNPAWRDLPWQVAEDHHWPVWMIDMAYAIKEKLFEELVHSAKLTRIESNPNISSGIPIIKGTRISLVTLSSMLQGGADAKGITKIYPHLTEEDVDEAQRFIAEYPDLFKAA